MDSRNRPNYNEERRDYWSRRNTSDQGRFVRQRDEDFYANSRDMDHYQQGVGYFSMEDHRNPERFRADERYYRDYRMNDERRDPRFEREDQYFDEYRNRRDRPTTPSYDWDMDDYEGRSAMPRHYDRMTSRDDDRWRNVFGGRRNYNRGEGFGLGGYEGRK